VNADDYREQGKSGAVMKGRRARSFLPPVAVLEMTYRCNNTCLYCSCPWDREDSRFERLPELTTGEWKEAIALLCEQGVTRLAFTGGEALLRPDIREIIDFSAGLEAEHVETVDGKLEVRIAPPQMYLLSNGKLLDLPTLEFIASRKVALSISLPGLSSYERHTGYDGADEIMGRFAAARELGIRTTANITVTKLDLPELEKTLAAAILSGASQVLLNRFLPGGRGLSHMDLLLSKEELLQMLEVADRVLTLSGRQGSLGTEVPLCAANPADYKSLKVATRCSAAIGFFVIGPSGYIRVCNHSEKRLVHFREWRKLKDDPYWKSFAFKKYMPAECGACPHRTACDAGCREAAHITGGSIDSMDPILAARVES
jgi:radical SAM protein with 4Fe4S-binding SPASM domain